MTTKEMIEIIQAYERGEDIEWKSKHNSDKGFIIPNCNYEFDFQSNYYRIKPKRYRAEKDVVYYYINYDLCVEEEVERFDESDDSCYKIGNYFCTKEDAKKVIELIKETLTKFHEENE